MVSWYNLQRIVAEQHISICRQITPVYIVYILKFANIYQIVIKSITNIIQEYFLTYFFLSKGELSSWNKNSKFLFVFFFLSKLHLRLQKWEINFWFIDGNQWNSASKLFLVVFDIGIMIVVPLGPSSCRLSSWSWHCRVTIFLFWIIL